MNTSESGQANKKMKKSFPAGMVNHWDRLPDSLILVIFNKVLDARSLIRCFLVCKHFSSLIQKTENVLIRMEYPFPLIPNFAPLDAFHNLRTFKEIKFLQIVFHARHRPNKHEPVRKRNIVYGSSFKEYCLCLAFYPASFPKYSRGDFIFDLKSSPIKSLSENLVERYESLSRRLLPHEFVKQHSLLKDVVIGDDKNTWRVTLGEELLARLRSSINGQVEEAESSSGSGMTIPQRIIMWWVRSLNLPRNECSVNQMVLLVHRTGNESIVLERDASFLLGTSGDGRGGNSCDEVVMEILNNKNEKVTFELEFP